MPESPTGGAVRNPDLLGVYCNDHVASARGGIELVSRMIGRWRGTRFEQPLEQLLGWVAFLGLRLEVGPGVFVPRLRTELLAELAA